MHEKQNEISHVPLHPLALTVTMILPQVKGKVYAFYNMGTRDFPIGEMFETLNDGKYHVVRFTRSGPNSTIQVDDLMMQTKMPRGGWTEHLVLPCCYLPPALAVSCMSRYRMFFH